MRSVWIRVRAPIENSHIFDCCAGSRCVSITVFMPEIALRGFLCGILVKRCKESSKLIWLPRLLLKFLQGLSSRICSRMAFTTSSSWLFHAIFCSLLFLRVGGSFVNITYVQNAVAKGAVCLDGTPPAYHLSPGFGSGVDNWLIQIEGGGWCNNISTCLSRKNSRLGSSNQMTKQIAFSGILSNRQSFNPDFYNWNRVKVRYCDGSSFTGDVARVNPVTKLHYRGERIWMAIMEDLLAKGMDRAENALLSGCSAGGLTSILHCDNFGALLPVTARVKCLSDAGFFINAKDINGSEHIKEFFNDVVTTHGSAKNLPSSCTSRLSPGMCLFPQYLVQQIQTPLFILNAAYDSWQIRNILAPGVADPHGLWHDCKLDIKQCSSSQIHTMQGFRTQFLQSLIETGDSSSRGFFINSCYAHCQSEMQETWFRYDSPLLGNKTIAEAVGDWFFSRSPFKKIDCPYPCNNSCQNNFSDFSGA